MVWSKVFWGYEEVFKPLETQMEIFKTMAKRELMDIGGGFKRLQALSSSLAKENTFRFVIRI